MAGCSSMATSVLAMVYLSGLIQQARPGVNGFGEALARLPFRVGGHSDAQLVGGIGNGKPAA